MFQYIFKQLCDGIESCLKKLSQNNKRTYSQDVYYKVNNTMYQSLNIILSELWIE